MRVHRITLMLAKLRRAASSHVGRYIAMWRRRKSKKSKRSKKRGDATVKKSKAEILAAAGVDDEKAEDEIAVMWGKGTYLGVKGLGR